MSEDVTARLGHQGDPVAGRVADVVARIAGPEPSDETPPVDVTGALADLATWWRTVSAGAPLTVACGRPASRRRPCPTRSSPASTQRTAPSTPARRSWSRDRGTRDDEAARTVIALLTRKEASAVVAQPAGHDRPRVDDGLRRGPRSRRERGRAPGRSDRPARRGSPRPGSRSSSASCWAPPPDAPPAWSTEPTSWRRPSSPIGSASVPRAGGAPGATRRTPAAWPRSSGSTWPPGLPLGLSDDAGRGAEATLALLALWPDPSVTASGPVLPYVWKRCISCWIRSSDGTFGRGPNAPQAAKASAMHMPKIAQTGQK